MKIPETVLRNSTSREALSKVKHHLTYWPILTLRNGLVTLPQGWGDAVTSQERRDDIAHRVCLQDPFRYGPSHCKIEKEGLMVVLGVKMFH